MGAALASRVIRQHARKFLAVHLGLLIAGSLLGPKLLSLTTLSFHPAANADSAVAQRKFDALFPSMAAEAFATVVFVSFEHNATESVDITSRADFARFDEALSTSLRAIYRSKFLYESYFSLTRVGLHGLANATLSADKSSALIKLGVNDPSYLVSGDEFADLIDAAVNALGPKQFLLEPRWFAGATGPTVFSRDLKRQTEHDVVFIDLISLPVSLFVLAVVLRSVRLLILPVIAMVCSIATSFLFVRFVAEQVDVVTLVPSIMMSSSVAFSVDYSLFLLSRYREEILQDQTPDVALDRVLAHAGHTVLVSGTTLAACWFVLTSFPVEIVSSVGIGAGLTTLVCIFVNLTLTPSMLALFPGFFSNLRVSSDPLHEVAAGLWNWLFRVERYARRLLRLPFALCWMCVHAPPPSAPSPREQWPVGGAMREPLVAARQLPPIEEETASRLGTPASAAVLDTPQSQDMALAPPAPPVPSPLPLLALDAPRVNAELDRLERDAPRVFALARCVTASPARSCGILLVLLACVTGPFAYLAWNFGHSNAFILQIPRGKIGTVAFERLGQRMGMGKLNPYDLVVSPGANDTHVHVLSEHFFAAVQRSVIRDVLLASPHVSPGNILAVLWINGRAVPFRGAGVSYETCMTPVGLALDACRTLRVVASRYVANGALSLRVELSVEPNSHAGMQWLRETRDKVRALEHVRVDIAGGAAETIDVVESVYNAFPRAVALTSLVVTGLVALAFRSVVVPLRCLFTMALTLSFVYGAANLTFQMGALEWAGLSAPGREVHWCAPVMLFGVLVGLALDYDVFLLTRIVEYRVMGFSERDAVRAGLTASFPVITVRTARR